MSKGNPMRGSGLIVSLPTSFWSGILNSRSSRPYWDRQAGELQ